MNGLTKSWRLAQKVSLAIGVPVLLLLGLRIDKDDSRKEFAQNTGLAFALLTVILVFLAWGAWSEFELLWPGVVALGFLVVFGSALFTVKPISPEAGEQAAVAAGAPRGRSRTS